MQDVQQTEAKNDRDTKLLLPRQLQAPDEVLGHEKHNDIGDEVDYARAQLAVVQREALSVGNRKVPAGLMGDALQVEGDDQSNAGGGLDSDHDHASPPEDAAVPGASRNQNTRPFEQHGSLEQRQDHDIGVSHHKHELDNT